ncbi:hypothetical protein CKO31_10600 [Thiohalocapsa halophila]|uniref:Addiction module protein n=1 Tax=Thiohalocapsa halophila TaxID=69359 RepID=A0ABS1CH63_9GAMM|nr:addiction module protein [Thiohalocapsa halophila]MBK1631182.1 hypothetical protein [Thiohalocapsa halophila]
MNPSNSKLFDDALALPVDERMRLVDTLLKSLNPGSDDLIDAAWHEEAERRLAALDRGEATLVNGEEVFERLRAKYRR